MYSESDELWRSADSSRGKGQDGFVAGDLHVEKQSEFTCPVTAIAEMSLCVNVNSTPQEIKQYDQKECATLRSVFLAQIYFLTSI